MLSQFVFSFDTFFRYLCKNILQIQFVIFRNLVGLGKNSRRSVCVCGAALMPIPQVTRPKLILHFQKKKNLTVLSNVMSVFLSVLYFFY